MLTTHFAPYRDDTFSVLSENINCSFKFLLTLKQHPHQEWNYDNPHNFGFEYVHEGVSFWKLGRLYSRYVAVLKEYKPDAVIISGNYACLLWAKFFSRHARVILMTDNIKDGSRLYELPPVRAFIKWCCGRADGVWCAGKRGRDFYVSKKNYVPDTKIRQGCYTNDTGKILANYSRYDREAERRRFGISDETYVFLFVGKLIHSRHVERILSAAERSEGTGRNLHFLIVGDGEDASLVEDYRHSHSNLTHIPSIPLDELESVYAASDAYIHLGEEPYSLALYEAAVLGMPIIASYGVGAVDDCVKNDVNGYVFSESYTPDALDEKMMKAANGDYDEGSAEMSGFILRERGTAWAAKQLAELLAL